MKKKRVYFNEVYSLKENEAVFLKRKNWIFSIVGGSISFVFFCFEQNIFTSKISIFLLPLGRRGPAAVNLDIRIESTTIFKKKEV